MSVEDRPENGMSRREFLAQAGRIAPLAVGAGMAAPRPRRASAQSPTKVRFTLPWVPGGSNLFAWVARNKGFWKKRGLDVEVARGYGSVAATQAVANGQFDFGQASTAIVILQASKGLPLASIGNLSYKSTMGVGMLADSPIKKPKDLEGKTVGWTVTSSEVPLFPVFVKNTGIDDKKIKFVNMNIDVRYRALMDRQIDAMTDFAVSAVPPLMSQGFPLRFMLYADHGMSIYESSLMTTPKMIKEKPEVCQAVFDGVFEAFVFGMLHPDEAIDVFLQEVRETGTSAKAREFVRLGMGIFQYCAMAEEARQNGQGWADPKKIAEINDIVATYLAAPGSRKPAVEEVFTNQFAGRIKLTASEWADAKKRHEEFARFLVSG